MVLEERITTVSPEGVEVTSPLVRVCGPNHNVAVGVSKFDALRNEKKPTHRAAFIGAASSTPLKY